MDNLVWIEQAKEFAPLLIVVYLFIKLIQVMWEGHINQKNGKGKVEVDYTCLSRTCPRCGYQFRDCVLIQKEQKHDQNQFSKI